jgi:hypothetical protein
VQQVEALVARELRLARTQEPGQPDGAHAKGRLALVAYLSRVLA